MLDRSRFELQIRRAVRANPVTALLGPRQCGKTTLARQIGDRAEVFDMEDPVSLRRLSEPMSALRPLRGLVVIDEVQLRPDLFPVLRVLADRKPLPARFLILGSASPDLIRQGSESLAGRIAQIELGGFTLEEAGADSLRRWWLRGGFPRSFLARSERDSLLWREDFIRTFLERDLRDLGVRVLPPVLRRMWMMLAHYHGQVWNASEISRSLGEAHTTVKRHLDTLTGALVVRQLQPWFENLGKRQIKAPKIYIRDSGLLHSLLGVDSFAALEGHPKIGASWEGLVVEETARIVGERNIYFWATQSGAELDILAETPKGRIGIEAKRGDAPGSTKSMRIAMEDLKLKRLLVVYPGDQSYDLGGGIRAIPLQALRSEIEQARPKRAVSGGAR